MCICGFRTVKYPASSSIRPLPHVLVHHYSTSLGIKFCNSLSTPPTTSQDIFFIIAVMKLIQVLPFAALSTAFVIPDEQVMSQVAIESDRIPEFFLERIPSKDEAVKQFRDSFTKLIDSSKNAFDNAIERATETKEEISGQAYETAYHVSSWLDSAADRVEELGEDVVSFSEDDQDHHAGHKGHHGHCKKPNMTVYELISKSKYTTKLAALINEYEDVVEVLNGTAANYSVSSS